MCKRLQQKEETLLNLEPQVLQGLGFDLIAHSAHSALAGFFMARGPPMAELNLCWCLSPGWHYGTSERITCSDLDHVGRCRRPCKACQNLAKASRGLKRCVY